MAYYPRLRDLREDADLTQEQLVKYRGCTKLPTPTANRASANRLLNGSFGWQSFTTFPLIPLPD